MPDKGTQEMRLALDGAGVAAADDRQLVNVGTREIRERFRLEVAPNVFDRIELGCVGREMGVTRPDARKEVSYVGRTVGIGSIPHQRHRRSGNA